MILLGKDRTVLLLSSIGALTGLVLLLLSWWESYPLSMDSPLDFVFNHISLLYWISLPILYVSLYALATRTARNWLRVAVIFSIVMTMYSLKFFYYRIPGSDSQYTRGMTEYFAETGDLDPSRQGHFYFQWPLLFVLEEMVHLVIGLDFLYVEFILFTAVTFLYVATLYLYSSKLDSNKAYLAVIAFFVLLPYVFEFQLVPVFVSIGIFLLAFMLQTSFPTREVPVATLIIFLSIALMHAFVVMFFIIYTLAMFLFKRKQMFLRLFVSELIIYLMILTFSAQPFLIQSVQSLTNFFSFEYSKIAFRTAAGGRVAPRIAIDLIAQNFSRIVTVGTALMLGAGFTLSLIKRKLRDTDKAILLSGLLYASIGTFLSILGNRSWFMIVIALSLGIMYKSRKLEKYFKSGLLIFLALFVFIQTSSSFYDIQTMYQTKAEYQAANFLIDNVNLSSPVALLSHFRSRTYLSAKGGSDDGAIFEHDLSEDFPININGSNYIFYTVGLGKSFLRLNLTDETFFEATGRINIIFNSASTYVAMRTEASS